MTSFFKTHFVTSFTLAGFLISCVQGSTNHSRLEEAWNANNNPANVGSFQYRLSALPTSAALEETPWSDTYWPSQQGGTANRWRGTGEAWSYQLYSAAELRNMSADEIKQLSPAEKYDIYRSRYDYPTVASERARTSSSMESWEGICHGWTPAALNYHEPKAVTLTNADGVTIPFGSSDIKAMLSLFSANAVQARFIGARCNVDLDTNPGARNSADCKDTNPGSFHLALGNLIGLQKRGFAADVTRSAQVWNQPVVGYHSQILSYQPPSSTAAAGTVREAIVQTRMFYTVEVEPHSRPLGLNQSVSSAIYTYVLELDGNDEIIGGEWVSDDRPDFLWSANKPDFSGNFAGLASLYKAATDGFGPGPIATPTPVGPIATPTPVGPIATPAPVVTPQPGLIEVSFHRSSNFQFLTTFEIKAKIQVMLSNAGIYDTFSLVPSGSGGGNLTLKLVNLSLARSSVVSALNAGGVTTL